MTEAAFTNETEAVLHAHGMHCHGCEHIIEVSVKKLPGVRKVKADYPSETVSLIFDPNTVDLDAIRAAIEQAGYRTYELDDPARRRGPLFRLAGLIAGVAGILLIIFFDTEWISKGGEPDVAQHLSLDLIFLLGLLTGFHCIGMCGGFVLSYTADDAAEGRRSYISHFLYGAGKTLSYTAMGAAFGLLGAFVTFTPLLRGAAGIGAGLFLIVFGLNMLGLFAPLRRFRLGLPAPLQAFVFREQSRAQHRPFVIGLLNGLMIACGPLQAMYVMAAGTGSAIEGAKMLFAFGIGTLPVLLSFGVLATLISGALTHRLLRLSGVIVVVLGAVMINRGLILTGSGYDLHSVTLSVSRTAQRFSQCWSQCFLGSQSASLFIAGQGQAPGLQPPGAATGQAALAPRPRPAFQTIRMDVVESGYTPNHFVLIRGVPVKWVIDGKKVTSCNHRIVVPSLKLEFDVKPGLQTIEFTPDHVGHIPWSCWMGMLHGDFDVVEPPQQAATSSAALTPQTEGEAASSCLPAAQSARPASYTIVVGDTLASVAKKFYHDAGRWHDIAAANPGLDVRRLHPGQEIKLPRPRGDVAR